MKKTTGEKLSVLLPGVGRIVSVESRSWSLL